MAIDSTFKNVFGKSMAKEIKKIIESTSVEKYPDSVELLLHDIQAEIKEGSISSGFLDNIKTRIDELYEKEEFEEHIKVLLTNVCSRLAIMQSGAFNDRTNAIATSKKGKGSMNDTKAISDAAESEADVKKKEEKKDAPFKKPGADNLKKEHKDNNKETK